MEENLIKRIGDSVLNTVYVDGQVYLHTDVDELAKVCKTAINENYYDIQRLENGDIQAGNTLLLNGASLSKAVDGQLVGSDDTVSTSLQVKNYVDLAVEGIELTPGPQGPQGERGETGEQGPQGDKGDKGDTGLQGIQGPQGDKGDTGLQGPQGERGETGEQGPKGDKGDTGDKGADGVGVAIGGTTGQILSKKSNSNYDTEWKNLDISGKADKTYVDTELGKKQNTLVNTENIKSINGTSLLGSGNINTPNTTYSEITDAEITAGTSSTLRSISGVRAKTIINKAKEGKQDSLVSGTNIKTVNGTSILGSGNITTPNTTYSEISSTEITAGTSSTERAISGRRSQEIVNKARVGLVEGNANTNNIVNNIFVGTQAEYDALPVKTGILAIIKE